MRLLCFILGSALMALALESPDRWVPLRWASSDPATLTVLENAAFNCLLLEESTWSSDFARKAQAKGFIVLASIPDAGKGTIQRAKRAMDLGADGIVLEGAFPDAEVTAVRTLSKNTIYLGLRSQIEIGPNAPAIIGTHQGVWAGINPHDETSHRAAPSGAPWIDTNSGLLRFLRAASPRTVWISAKAPANSIINLSRYMMLVGDAAMLGARWVVQFEKIFFEKLVAGEAKATRDFQKLNQLVRFLEEHRALSQLPAYGQLAVVEDVHNGALLSGSIMDMIGVKHTPVRPVPTQQIRADLFAQTKMAINVDPPSLNAEQSAILKGFAKGGGTVLTAPAGWRMPEPKPGQVTLDEKDVEKLDQIWKEVNTMTGRRNLGARFFNVSSMLSSMTATPDGKKVVVYLTNYSDFPVDSIAIHLLGKFSKATVYWPERKAKPIELYENEDGSGLDVDILESTAILIAER